MSEVPSLKFHAGLVLCIAALAALPALWSLGSAIHSAATTGQVLVMSIGRFETNQLMVPWREGWARFVGPVLVVAALFLSSASARSDRRWWWTAAALALAGLAMLAFSWWFISLGGAAAFVAGNAFIALCFYVDHYYGRWKAFVLMLVAVLTLVYLFAPR
ncbi:hypothetical protein HZ993_15270 [Rhodoferax sp. AJA081-3]|uniref:hypothetical protein n=1 Tax=Rhodoferax sp. AJA081-3 TaxID=2752316 RepID=UPI001AE02EB1|nr:hypothetical protein [Rhodoferax sp. AJA081-3]QTN26671.1 hypothetical protein HZ993_15270 [Rhodoferax sp. AJA081-3]